MPKLFLIPEVVSQKIHVFLNVDHHPLAVELKNQLSSHEHVQLATNIREADVCIYLAGFDPPSLSETLSHTSELYEDLKQVKSDRHKFILVVKNPTSHLSRTAITLTNQFAHNYGLNHEIFEYDQSFTPAQLAQVIIRKFIYGHSAPAHHTESPSVEPSPVPSLIAYQSPTPKVPKRLNRWYFLPLVIFIPWVFSGLLLGVLLALSTCLYTQPLCTSISSHSHNLLRYSTRLSPGISSLATRVGLPSAQFGEVLHTLIKLSQISQSTSQKSATYLDSIFSDRPQLPAENVLAGLSESDRLLNQLQADLRSLYLSTPVHIPSFEKIALQAQDTRHTLNSLLPNLTEFVTSFSSGKKTYLVVLQDNWELRASGGLVETFLKVDIENGKVDQFQPFSTKETDKLLKGTVVPPVDFQDLTHESQWSMRDATWDPSVKNTLEKLAWFAENEISQPIDGVILLDLKTLQGLVQIIGSVQVGESQVGVTSQNFSSIYQSQLNGTQDYSQYLESLLSAVFSQLGSLDTTRNQKIVDFFYHQIKNRQVFITSISEGEIGLPECRSFLPCLVGYAYPVSSNISGSKTNFYLQKSQKTSITLTDTMQTTRHEFTYSYSPPTNSWVGPNHQEYMRVYTPNNITSDYTVTIDGVPLPTDSIHTGTSSGVSYLGASFTVNKTQPIKVDFTYHTPVPKDRQFHYQFDLPNQPGVIGDNVIVDISYPPAWAALVDKSASVATAGHLEYNYAQPNSFQLNIDFTKP